MKRNSDIEKILRDAKLPDHDMSGSMHDAWQKLIEERQKYQKRHPVLLIKPWMWALASVILIVICVAVMICMIR